MSDSYFVVLARPDRLPNAEVVNVNGEVVLFKSEMEARAAMRMHDYGQAFGYAVYPWTTE